MSLFKSQEDMFAKPYRQAFAVITDGKAEIRLTGLPFGEYALVVFHDENKNGSVDHNIFRFPKEALGFPNGYRFGLKQGTPTFEKLRIIFDNRTPPLVIRLE
ncbi:MAG: DUF2141 domain-containing protein [Deltaproteobacteria bacterium]|nr:DUF2141 domain-containing protein [Deltaproteobacteria bacterium]